VQLEPVHVPPDGIQVPGGDAGVLQPEGTEDWLPEMSEQ